MDIKYIIPIFLVCISLLIIASCVEEKIDGTPAPEKAVEEAQVIEPEEDIEDIEFIPPEYTEEPLAVQKVSINHFRNSFDKDEVTAAPETIVTWVNTDDRPHKIACYAEKKLVFLSPQYKPGESFSYIFTKPGSYRCRDVVFGYWGNINIITEETPTGFAVVSDVVDYSIDNPIEISMVLIIIVLFSIHGVQLWKKHNSQKEL